MTIIAKTPRTRLLWTARALVAALVLTLGGGAELAHAAWPQQPPPVEPPSQQPSEVIPDPAQGPLQPQPPPPDEPLPEAPSAVQPERQAAPRAQQPAQPPVEPEGTAAAERAETLGGAASKPAGTAIAPAKQRQVRSFLIKLGAVAGVGLAVGTVYLLSNRTPSTPPNTR